MFSWELNLCQIRNKDLYVVKVNYDVIITAAFPLVILIVYIKAHFIGEYYMSVFL